MSNRSFESYPTDMGRPKSTVEDHKNNVPTQIHWWTDYVVEQKGKFTATHGTKHYFDSDNQFGVGGIQDAGAGGIWQPSGQKGWKYDGYKSGVAHGSNVEIKAKNSNRWMSAAMYNGCAFEWHANYGSTHAIWLDHWAVIFTHATTNSNYRFVSVNASSSPASGYRYYAHDSNTDINEIRGWGTDYLLYGFILKLKNSGSGAGSHATTVKAFNFKVHHKCDSTSSNHRIIVPKGRTYADRNASILAY